MNLSDSYSPVLGYLALGILVFVGGSFIGSFCSKVVYRLEDNRVRRLLSASFCPACGKKLKTLDKIPIIGYFRSGGHCRKCGAPITRRYLYFEIIGAVLPFIVGYLNNFDLNSLAIYLFYMALLTQGVIGYDRFSLPVKVSVFILLLSLVEVLLKVNSITSMVACLMVGLIAVFILYTYLSRSERLSSAIFFGCSAAFIGSIVCTLAILIVFVVLSLALRLYYYLEEKKNVPYNLLLVILVGLGSVFEPFIIEKALSLLTFIVS